MRTKNATEGAGADKDGAIRVGTVTFLDVLGWKGIWLRRDSQEVVVQLKKLVALAQRRARGGADTTVLSISDTIVLLSEGELCEGIELHGAITAELICRSIEYGLPLRGATACGEYSHEEPSIVVGAAVDEAASWHEAVDWIGVVQTPSAFLVHAGSASWKKHRPPLKGGGLTAEIPCVDWPSAWAKRGLSRDELRGKFKGMGPFDTSVAAKYLHTLAFFDAVAKLG